MTIEKIKKTYITKIPTDIVEAFDFIIALLNTDSRLFKDYWNCPGRFFSLCIHSHQKGIKIKHPPNLVFESRQGENTEN